jgi:hypothetical protein
VVGLVLLVPLLSIIAFLAFADQTLTLLSSSPFLPLLPYSIRYQATVSIIAFLVFADQTLTPLLLLPYFIFPGNSVSAAEKERRKKQQDADRERAAELKAKAAARQVGKIR